MPNVNIRITDERVAGEQKDELVKRVTQMLFDVLRKVPATTFVVIDEIPTDNWSVGGALVSDFRSGAG